MNIKVERDKLYLVTGGSGFLGRALIKRITDLGGKVRCLSRNEGNMIKISQDYPIEIYPGDICDPVDVVQACKGVSGVFHLAAFKFVGLAEKFTRECIRSNTLGSLNILEASLNNNFDFIIGISTDKAAQMSGVYGASKFLMEKLFEQFESINQKVKYRIVRYGNVMYSTGSVMCKWKELMLKNEPCIITDINATRFYWTVDDAINLIFECLDKATDSSPYCPKMKSITIGDLFEAMSQLYYKTPIDPIIIGLQPGENMHEVIKKGIPDSFESERYTVEEIKKML